MAWEGFSISKLPQRTQLLLFTLLILGFCYLFYIRFVQPVRAETEGIGQEIAALKVEVQKGQIVQARLPEFKEEIRRQQEKLDKLQEILPEQKETAEILRNIQKLAEASNLKIVKVLPQKTVRYEFYEDWPIIISIEGNYNNLGSFFERVGKFTRIINVDNITITGLEENVTRNRIIAATCRATTFVFLESATTS